MGCTYSRRHGNIKPQLSEASSQDGSKGTKSKSDKKQSSARENISTNGVSLTTLKVLLVADEQDNFFKELATAIDQKKFTKMWLPTSASYMPTFVPDVVFADIRNGPMNESLLRTLKSFKLDHPMLFIAVIKVSNEKEKEDLTISSAKMGFDRVLVEDSNINLSLYLTEAQNIHCSQEFLRASMMLNESVHTALDKSRDLVLITDSNSVVQYVNVPFLQVLGYSREEVVTKVATKFQDNLDLVPALRQLEKGFEWVGKIRWRSKNGETVGLQCRALPFTPVTNLPTYYLYMQDSSLENHIYPRGSLPSIRKGSYDLKSIISEGSARRQSLAKLYNLPLEAPITKVLSLLCAAQENASPAVYQMLEQVMDILRTTELYTSHLKTDNLRAEDPLTANLIAALVANGPPSAVMPRRSSNESIVSKKKQVNKKNIMLPMSKDLKDVMEKIHYWDFDVIQTEKLTGGKPLVYVGMRIFCSFNVHKTLMIDDKTIYGWLVMMERHYKPMNTYHNSTHAADVLQASACFLSKLRQKKLLEPLDEACCLIAAAAHDLGHPGKSSAFLTNSGDELAVLYNDISVLEQHHAALTFQLTLKDERVNIFKGLDRKTYTSARACVIDTILATDMYKHFEHFTKFVTVFNKPSEDIDNRMDRKEGENDNTDENNINPEDLMLVKRMLIKCADVSNPTRPLHLCKEWASRIAEEYFAQTDEEKARNLPVVMPLFDRLTCSIPVSQMGFMDYIVNNMIEEWDAFIEIPEMLYHLRKNYDHWKELNDKGITGIDETDNRNIKKTPEVHANVNLPMLEELPTSSTSSPVKNDKIENQNQE